MQIATIISILMASTDVGTASKSPAMAMAKTARTSQVRSMTKMRNISRVRGLIIEEVISAIDLPFSFRLTTSAPKSCTAPMKMVPITIQTRAGSQPQYAATQGPMIGAAPAIDVK